MSADLYYFLVSEQIEDGARTTSILITEARSQTRAEQQFFEEFGKAALDSVQTLSREDFIYRCAINVTPWVIDNLENQQRLQPSEFYYKMQVHSRFG